MAFAAERGSRGSGGRVHRTNFGGWKVLVRVCQLHKESNVFVCVCVCMYLFGCSVMLAGWANSLRAV